MRSFRRALIAAVACAGFVVPLGAAGVARADSSPASPASPVQVGTPWQHPAAQPPSGPFASFSDSSQDAAETAAVGQARATGKATVVGSLTTGTQLVAAQPDGTLSSASSVLPVRVRTRAGWVPVDTRLRPAGGRLSAVAVPGDTVSFSAGGTSAAAQIRKGSSSFGLWWPGALPAPAVSGSSATYRDVLPGVNLVLTAVSGQEGGFREVLVVASRAAASDPGLASLAWRVSAPGTSGLRVLPGGGLAAAAPAGGGFAAPAPVMWDSSALAPGSSRSAMRAARSSARAAGAALAAGGLGVVSTDAAPASGARLAAVAARMAGGGGELMLVPDARLLSSPATRFPVFIDPSFSPYDDTGKETAFDPVQSQCPGASFDKAIGGFSPVGYDNFNQGNCTSNDTDYSLYRLAIPAGALSSQGHLLQASLQITEVYSSDCSSTATMSATWIGGIGSGTGWPGPGPASGNVDETASFGPDTYTDSSGTHSSCNTVLNAGVTQSAGINVTTDLAKAGASATDITFRVWEDVAHNPADPGNGGQPSEVLHKQLTTNPTLEVHWTYSPSAPSALEQAASSGGASSMDCVTSSASAPKIGKTIAQGGVYLLAHLAEPGDPNVKQAVPDVTYNVRYATGAGTPSWTTVPNVETGASGTAFAYKLPASVTSANGTVQWEAQASVTVSFNGTSHTYTSAWPKSPCYFTVDLTAPDPPGLVPDWTPVTAAQQSGSMISFTITQSANDTASEFVLGFDTPAQVGGTIPSSRTCLTTAATLYCSQIKNGSATLTFGAGGPGPHDVWVYEIDSAGNASQPTNSAPPGQSWTYTIAGDTATSYTSKASLQLNLADAEASAAGNALISKAAGSTSGAAGDGHGNSFDEAEMQSAGWKTGGMVTVDGASFTLPKFGPSASGPDNLMSANQTIGAGNGAHGSAVVFLATSTQAWVQLAGTIGSGSDDGDSVLNNSTAPDVTAPVTPGGSPVTGAGCSMETVYNASVTCGPATGTVNYSGTCAAAGNNQTSFYLTVPDWVDGPSDIAALELSHRDTNGAQQADSPKIYAYAVPIPASCTVASVTLPDVGEIPAEATLHIFGIALRNTTTATPAAGASVTPAMPASQGWTGAFASPIENAYNPPSGHTWGNQTVRIAVSPSVSAAQTTSYVRIRLSDPGYWSQDGTGPLQIGAASIAPEAPGSPPSAAASQAPTALKFNGLTVASIPEGGDIYSDPIPLPFAVAPGAGILVSLWLTNPSLPVLPLNDEPSGAQAWFAPASTPNQTGSQAATPFTGTGGYLTPTVPVLTGVDVTTPPPPGMTPAPPGEPTVVVTGQGGLVDGEASTVPSDAGNDPSQRLAGQLTSQGDAAGYGVVDASVDSDMVTQDLPPADLGIGGGLALEYRLDHDVLAEPDLGSVVISIGLEDALNNSDPAIIDDGIKDIARLLFASGLVTQGPGLSGGAGVVIATQTPCTPYANDLTQNTCDPMIAEPNRVAVNQGLSLMSALGCEADFSAALAQPGSSPAALQAAYDDGDHANLTLGTAGGYAALAPAVSNCGGFAPPLYPFPAP